MNNEKNKTSSEVVLKIDGLSKGYKMFARKKDRIIETLFPTVERHGIFEAMHDFNLEVKKGEVLGVLGKMELENQHY